LYKFFTTKATKGFHKDAETPGRTA